jgi:GAF domain-containing protein
MEAADVFDLTLLLSAILHRAAAWVNTPHGYIGLYDHQTEAIHVVYGLGFLEQYIEVYVPSGEGLSGSVYARNEVIVLSDYMQWEGRATPETLQDRPMGTAAVGVPIRMDGKAVGVIGLFYMEVERQFSDEEIAFLTRMGEVAGTVLENALRTPYSNLDDHIEDFHEAVPLL